MHTDLEEAKGHEILKLHNSLQAIHAIVHETYALLTKERESAQKAVEEAFAIVQETSPIRVEDTVKIDKLSAEVEKLKAARETGALQEANDRLQKQVEGFTWRLKLAKHVKTDLEEAQGHEILDLQNFLQAKVDETNALLTKERESAQKKIDDLSAEVEEQKSLLESERNRANESEKKCTEALETGEIKQQKLDETVKRVNQLQESLITHEERLSDLKEEEKILRWLFSINAEITKTHVDSHVWLMTDDRC